MTVAGHFYVIRKSDPTTFQYGLASRNCGCDARYAFTRSVRLERHRQEVERLLQALVRLGAAEAQEAGAGLAEALAAQAGDAELVVGAFAAGTAPGRGR